MADLDTRRVAGGAAWKNSGMKLGLLIVRVVLGALFVGHGAQKLFGWFGGHGLEGTAGFMESVGLRPGRKHATAAAVTETASGALLVAGLATPAAAAGLTSVMATAIRTVHAPNGVWNTEGGYEYNLVIVAAALALADVGPGDLSLDHALGTELHGPFWALAALAAGIGASAWTISQVEAEPQAEQPEQAGAPAAPQEAAPVGS
jgi:putative oxidoreductase